MLYTGQLSQNEFPILLVEDDSTTADIMQRVSKTAFPEAQFIHKTSFKEATDFYFNIDGAWPKLIVLDIYLFGYETGLQFLEFIKDQPLGSLIPVIVLSGSQSSKDVDDAYMLGAASYLSKPAELVGWKNLMTSIRTYWNSTVLPDSPFNFDQLSQN